MPQLEIRGQTKHLLNVQESQRISDVKEAIAQIVHIPASEILLYNAGTPLQDCVTVSDLQNFVLDLTVPLLGGKVHGSLARAGKVKGQTPKVEPQDKKKKKTGRAKRRMQHSRRFKNTAPTFGRRKGPNANS